MDFTGKRSDVIDLGGEVDYSNIQWFQDPPQRPQVCLCVGILAFSLFTKHTRQAPQQPTAPSYEPSLAVIKKKAVLQRALNSASNVLYQRYKQYGQVCYKPTIYHAYGALIKLK